LAIGPGSLERSQRAREKREESESGPYLEASREDRMGETKKKEDENNPDRG
jgi:hypothetical protein